MRERTGMIARLAAPAIGVRDERLEQPHQRAPLLHGAAKIVHRGLVGAFRIGQSEPRFAENLAGDGAQSGTDGRIGLQCGLGTRGWFCGAVHGRRQSPGLPYHTAKYVACALPFLGGACYMNATENQAFAAGWSSPVAR